MLTSFLLRRWKKAYTGHSDDVKILRFFAEDALFLSTAEFDRYINVYDPSNATSAPVHCT
jgi:hypothetical protein